MRLESSCSPPPVPGRRLRRRKHGPRLLLLALLSLAVCATPDRIACAAPAADASAALRFADELLRLGEPERAVHEYMRALFQADWDSSRTAGLAVVGVARAHNAAEAYDQTVRWAGTLKASSIAPCRTIEVGMLTATAFLRMGRPREAEHELLARPACPGDTAWADQRDYLLGISHVQLDRWAEASADFGRVPAASSLAAAAADYRQRALRGATLPHHDRALAGVLGVVPGLGYLYCGLPQTAVAAAIVTGVFVEATREAFLHDQNALGGFTLAFGLSWYAGSIYGSVQSAGRVDRFYRQRFQDEFQY